MNEAVDAAVEALAVDLERNLPRITTPMYSGSEAVWVGDRVRSQPKPQ